MITTLILITLTLYLLTALLLILGYTKTKNNGFLWLFLPLVILPIVSIPLSLLVQTGIDNITIAHFPFTLVTHGKITMGQLITTINLTEHVAWGILSVMAIWIMNSKIKFCSH